MIRIDRPIRLGADTSPALTGLRTVIFAVLMTALLGLASDPAGAERRHGLSAFGNLKYPADFTHFDYVNPDAPKGGRIVTVGAGGNATFNTFNGFILKGDAAHGLELQFDTLMEPANDEPDAMYGLVAKSVELTGNGAEAIFYLRKAARFADGSPLTANDVVFSFETLKEKGHPSYQLGLRDVMSAKALDEHTVRFTFADGSARDLPLMVAGLPILSKAYYSSREFAETTLEPPLGSGPYKISDFAPGRSLTYQLREDYWARDLPVNRGRYNFGEIKYEYFRDPTTEFEALKAGVIDFREELTARNWATQYDIPAVKEGHLIRDVLPDERSSGVQGFFINLRREKFQDRKVRAALDLAFDYEWTNKNQFYSLYQRIDSFFEKSAMKAEGPPDAAELALLEPYRDQLPASVFQEAYKPPVSDGSGQDRQLLRHASALLKEAGWGVEDGKRVNASGDVMEIEFLILSPTWERVIAPYLKNLKLLGIKVDVRRVDPAQFQERIEQYDFDIVTQRYLLGTTPGIELRNYWGSDAATMRGTRNLAGIANPVVDALIEKVIKARTREQLNTAGQALDRVLRAEHFWVPHWYKAHFRIAYWNKFSRPEIKPKYGLGVIDTWWYDEKKADKLAEVR